MPDATGAAAVSTWQRSAKVAAITLWGPALVPLVTGMLRECGHCTQSYLLSLPLVPGIIVPVVLRLDDAGFFVVGGVCTLLAWSGLAVALQRLRRPFAAALQVAVVLAVAAEAIGFAKLLRM